MLAEHIAHLFIRDPISLFAEKLDLDDEVEVDHFEVRFSFDVVVVVVFFKLPHEKSRTFSETTCPSNFIMLMLCAW